MTRTPRINPSSSLVHESIVVREVRLCMLGRIERIRRIVAIGKIPVGLEGIPQPGDNARTAIVMPRWPGSRLTTAKSRAGCTSAAKTNSPSQIGDT
jgi:hypothetical protein